MAVFHWRSLLLPAAAAVKDSQVTGSETDPEVMTRLPVPVMAVATHMPLPYARPLQLLSAAEVLEVQLMPSGLVIIRVPAWCKNPAIQLNGQVQTVKPVNGIITISRNWQTGDEVVLDMPMEITTTNGGRNSRTIERGPLVYALKLPGT